MLWYSIVSTLCAEVSFWHGFQHLKSLLHGLSVGLPDRHRRDGLCYSDSGQKALGLAHVPLHTVK